MGALERDAGKPSDPHPERDPWAANAPPGRLIDSVVAATESRNARESANLAKFISARTMEEALRWWFKPWLRRGVTPSKECLGRWINRDIATLDQLLCAQVNAILHHPRFQQLESSWRGLEYLVEQADAYEDVKIRVLNVSWKELVRDEERAIEFDQSHLFRKVYSQEFDMPGGEPFGLLIGDYQIQHRPSAEHPTDDIATLTGISHVAAAAFAPFVTSAAPAMFGMERFSELEVPRDLSRIFTEKEYLKWRSLRESEDGRFVALALPRVLMRLPYEDDPGREDGFRFREDVEGRDSTKYLWGNAAYTFAAVVIRAFDSAGWLAEIRGVQRGELGGGLVTELPAHCFNTDKHGVALKSSTDVTITDDRENLLGELGFLPLCDCNDSEFAAFYGCQSIQKPKTYDRIAATVNARLSSMLQCMLCVARFAHCLKVKVRDKVGTFTEASECENFLHEWLQRYVTSDDEASPAVKARFPLREAQVEVREHPEQPGNYMCVAHLRPHFQLDELTAAVRIVTELAPGRPV